eukprot:g5782.t1
MAEDGGVEMEGMDTSPNVSSMGEDITPQRRATMHTGKRTKLTMDGWSGHPWYKKAMQTTWWICFLNTAFFVVGTGNFFTSTMRVDARRTVAYQILLRVYQIFWHPFAGWIVDAEIGQSAMNRCGLSRTKCGRRVPYFVISNLLVLILGFFTWRSPEWAIMATKIEPDRRLHGYEFTQYQYYGDDIKPWPSDGLMTEKNGLDCSKKLRVFAKNGTMFNFNITRNTGEANEIPVYGHDICESLVSQYSVCWPGPTGAPDAGDGGKRVCAEMAHQTLADHFFILSLLYYTFSSPGLRSAAASTIEVYPWKEERMQLKSYSPFIGGVSFVFYLICNAFVTSFNEHTTRPSGISAMKDAKQQTSKDERSVHIWSEYKDILTNPSTFYVRWMLILWFPGGIMGSYYINTVLYWAFFSYGLAPEDLVWFGLAAYFTGMFVSCACNCVWGLGFFGKKSKKGREYSVNPLKYALFFGVLSFIIGTTVYLTMYTPIDRQILKDGGKNDWVKLYLGGVITGFWGFPQSYWHASAWQWAIDFDNQSRHNSGHKRREAVIGALSASISAASSAIGITIAVVTIASLCDTRLRPGDLTEKCYMTLYNSYLYPLFFLVPYGLVGMYFYPIKGEKLKQLYRKQGDYQDAIQHTDSWATVVQATP